jgi:conjugative relaxase-like TrwC/TraI family protein
LRAGAGADHLLRHSAEYLTAAVAAGRENYYTGAVAAGEPPGRWYGAGAQALGLAGLVDTQDMTALYERFLDPRDPAFRDPSRWDGAATLGHTGRRYATEQEIYTAAQQAEPDASPERRAELWVEAGKRARRNVSFLDATFSVQKSVTVLHTAFEAQEVAAQRAGDTEAATAWGAHREAVEAAIWAGNQAALDYLAAHAGFSRVGHHGGAAGRFIDAHDWTIASFFQHDSRDHDPQLHIHNAILNRVQGSDGVWRTLDSRAIHRFRGAAAAVGERTMEEHLTASLGVRFATRPDGKAREILGVRAEVMDLFSSRRRAITAKTAELVEAFETRFARLPNSLELDRLQRQATFATRPVKSHERETAEQRLDRWDAELRAEVAGGMAGVAADVLALAGQGPPAEEWSPAEILETALADVQATKSAWTAADLTRAVSDALPDHLGNLNGDQVAALLDRLTAHALESAVPLDAERPGERVLPAELTLADGRSAYQAPGGRLYATPAHVHTERTLLASTAHRGLPALDSAGAAAFVGSLAETGIELGADQAAAVRGALTSGAEVEALVGPAGTGKSFTVGALAKAWQDPSLWDGARRSVVGLATSQIATEILDGEGLQARNVARWLATQQRLADGRPDADDLRWRLAAGDLVVVDESAMTTTADLAAIHARVSAAGAKLLLTGDHRQLAAVGAGGGMDLVAAAGPSYELVEARRFAAAWEREASLRLREGDATALFAYHRHGRLVDAGTVEQAERSAARAWLADTLDGKRSQLVVDSNEQAARISAQLRAELVRLGRVAEQGVPLRLQGTYAGVGDLVQARRNGWELAGVEGNRRGPINRETYRVVETRDDGGLVVAPVLGRPGAGEQLGQPMTLPGDYVCEYVALGYAFTAHAAQGLTVDTSHTVITQTSGPRALYVGMSRGRYANTAHVTTRAVPPDAPAGATREAVHRSPAAVLAGVLETADPQPSALAAAVDSDREAGSVRTAAELLADAAELVTAGRTARWLDQLVAAGHLSVDQRIALAAEDGGATLTRVLRRAELAGHDPQPVLADAVTSRPLDDARQLTNVLHHRITGSVSLDPVAATHADWIPKVDDPQWRQYLAALADEADRRRRELGRQTADLRPQWAVEALGPVPHEREERAEWEDRAGTVAAHRELTGHDDPATALGDPPNPGQVEAYASWRAAWRAIGRPEADRDELEMSDGQLHVRIRAYRREEAWAPRYVANELAGTNQAAVRQRATAALRAAEAAAAHDTEHRARLHNEAAEAKALADMLDARAARLEAADAARAEWLLHTAETRAAADRAQMELAARRTSDGRQDERITAEEWLAEHAAEQRVEDPHRPISDEADLADVVARRDADTRSVATEPDPTTAETAVPDIRDLAADEPKPTGEDDVRVPSSDETAATIQRAQRALTEIQQRRVADQRQAAERDRADQLARWHTDDHAADGQTVDRATVQAAPTPVLDLAASLD